MKKTPSREQEIATERVEIRITPTQFQQWNALALERGSSLKALIVSAVSAYADRGDEAALADVGREVIAVVRRSGL